MYQLIKGLFDECFSHSEDKEEGKIAFELVFEAILEIEGLNQNSSHHFELKEKRKLRNLAINRMNSCNKSCMVSVSNEFTFKPEIG
jgi:hypothetical protein